MRIFKCPYCRAGYRFNLDQISFRQRGQANCEVCVKVMYSWNGYQVPSFSLIERSEEKSPADNIS
jgi:predicted Zn finger-like uncharacterized protein